MPKPIRLSVILAGLLALAALQSCKKDFMPQLSELYPEILVIFSPDALGDMSYNDEILRGIELFINEPEPVFYISFISPEDLFDVEFLIQMWWDERDISYEEDGRIPRKLLVLASSEYADIARQIIDSGSIVDGCYNYCKDITAPKAATVIGEIAATSVAGSTIKNCHHTGTVASCSDANFTDGGGNLSDL